MNLNDNLSTWANAHVFYNTFKHKPNIDDNKILREEHDWRKNAINNSIHGNLLTNNSLFNVLKNKNKIYLAHITPNIHNILDNNDIYPSGGCLVGSIYCTPAFEEGEKIRVHNLGKYIFENEAPRFSNSKTPNSSSVIVFECRVPLS